jgi:hypothetical protein
MITLLGALLGFLTSVAPEIISFFRSAQDNAHELAVMQLQIEAQKEANQQRLEEIGIQADSATMQALYASIKPTGVLWVDALSGTVRPIITYCFFLAYVAVKIAQYHAITHAEALPWMSEPVKSQEWFRVVLLLWSEEDAGLFAAVMTFWFGDRAMSKRRG